MGSSDVRLSMPDSGLQMRCIDEPPPNGQGLAAALRARANATATGDGRDSKTQKRPDLARAQRGQLHPVVGPPAPFV
jgi:hypothetical protein